MNTSYNFYFPVDHHPINLHPFHENEITNIYQIQNHGFIQLEFAKHANIQIDLTGAFISSKSLTISIFVLIHSTGHWTISIWLIRKFNTKYTTITHFICTNEYIISSQSSSNQPAPFPPKTHQIQNDHIQKFKSTVHDRRALVHPNDALWISDGAGSAFDISPLLFTTIAFCCICNRCRSAISIQEAHPNRSSCGRGCPVSITRDAPGRCVIMQWRVHSVHIAF